MIPLALLCLVPTAAVADTCEQHGLMCCVKALTLNQQFCAKPGILGCGTGSVPSFGCKYTPRTSKKKSAR
jgi:hypothetical protein